MAEKPEDLNLPTAVVSRLIKEVLPEGINISKEARAAICKSASVFVLYATSCANNLAVKHKRKTLTAKDVLDAVDEMEFETFLEPLKEGLEAFKKEQKGKKDAAELKRKQKVEAAEKKEILEKKKKDSSVSQVADDDSNENEPISGVEEINQPSNDVEEVKPTETSDMQEEKAKEDDD